VQLHVAPETGKPTQDGRLVRRRNERWQRVPLSTDVMVSLGPDHPRVIALDDQGFPKLHLYLKVNPAPGGIIVTAALVNHQREPEHDRVASELATYFQVSLRASPVAPAALMARPGRTATTDQDARVAELIFRHVREYGVGHTCSVRWPEAAEPPPWCETEWLPRAIVRRMKPEGAAAFDALRRSPGECPVDPDWMADEASDAALIRALGQVPRAYEGWLDEQEARIPSLGEESLQVTARENIARARECASRMWRSVRLLEQDDAARTAWRLANAAMSLQFRWTKDGEKLRWHPFQLGFQLLVLESLANPDSPHRGTMVLLWFPTGGGKTEAYLALTAFLLFHRRLRYGDEEGSGTAVLMRYTLRLLTIQQFQRAAALIMACEAIRVGDEQARAMHGSDLGSTPFSIGLWVGGAATPNTFEEARQALQRGGPSSPRQLERCPRCGHRLDYFANERFKSIWVLCTNGACCFSKGDRSIPLWVVDDDVYAQRPSLLIATIDKLAQVVRVPKSRSLFGLGTNSHPPQLILQDELHLISGPLGSIAGLFEGAVDRLCSHPVDHALQRPKVIGSTATIRRAADQIAALFDRQACQFPPPIIDAGNSGFGIEDREDPGRLYVGLTTAGRSAKYSLQATYASLLQGTQDRRLGVGPAPRIRRDAYWTLSGYFNSIRELGGAVTLVMDDVRKTLRTLARRHGDGVERPTDSLRELTSRIPSAEIPRILEDLQQPFDQPGHVDVLLASNMISVGVDVGRLGLMVVTSQPKAISEYIQATSRVGRKYPGIVVVVYNHNRARDRSHFETFPTWHSALYRAVEATSVTPFASRARDRALHAVVVALARHLVSGLLTEPALTEARASRVREVADWIVQRAGRVDPAEVPGVEERVDIFLEDWQERAGQLRAYWSERDHASSLLIGAEHAVTLEERGEGTSAWAAPNSMREVEPSSMFRLFLQPTVGRSRRRSSHASE